MDHLVLLGILYNDTGEVNKALGLFDRLFTLDPSFGDAITYQIKEILKKNSNIGEAYLLAQRIFVFQKEYERAIEAIKRAGELAPDNEDIILKEGQIYYEMGAADKAIKLYTDLLEKTKNRKAIYRLIRKTRRIYPHTRFHMRGISFTTRRRMCLSCKKAGERQYSCPWPQVRPVFFFVKNTLLLHII